MKSILFALALLQVCLSQAQVKDSIKYWKPNEKLIWGDFKGVSRNEPSPYDRANSSMSYRAIYSEDAEYKYDIKVMFLRYKSWSIDSTSTVLSHEQLHFDIAEYYARKMRKGLSLIIKRKGTDDELSNYIRKMIAEEHKFQDTYDRETAHGVYQDKQLLWERKIQNEMQALSAFSSV